MSSCKVPNVTTFLWRQIERRAIVVYQCISQSDHHIAQSLSNMYLNCPCCSQNKGYVGLSSCLDGCWWPRNRPGRKMNCNLKGFEPKPPWCPNKLRLLEWTNNIILVVLATRKVATTIMTSLCPGPLLMQLNKHTHTSQTHTLAHIPSSHCKGGYPHVHTRSIKVITYGQNNEHGQKQLPCFFSVPNIQTYSL